MAFPIVLARNSEFCIERKKSMDKYQKYCEDVKAVELAEKHKFDAIAHDERKEVLTDSDHLELAKYVVTQYNKTYYIDSIDRYYGIPATIFDYAFIYDHDAEAENKYYFENMRNYSVHSEHLKLSFGDIEKGAENAKAIYIYILDTLKKLDINVHNVEINMKNFKNRSEMCNEAVSFIFSCKKNNYRFNVEFIDDGDCFPGMLFVKKITNEKTKFEKIVHCDLFCQNTTENNLANLMMLFTCDTVEEFKNLITETGIKIIKMFNDNKFSVSDFSNGDEYYGSDILEQEYEYVIESMVGNCRIEIKKTLTGFGYTIGPSFDKGTDEYSQQYLANSYYYELKTDSDISKLFNCIYANINMYQGTYGYLDIDNNIWRNDNTIIEYLRQFKFNSDDVMQIIYPSCDFVQNCAETFKPKLTDDYYKYNELKANIDFNISICVGRNRDAVTYDFAKSGIEWPVEFYNIRFTYDKKKSDKCYMTIEGKYQMLNFVKDYYVDRSAFCKNYNKVKSHIGTENYEGDFDTVFNKLQEFVNILATANNIKKSKPITDR